MYTFVKQLRNLHQQDTALISRVTCTATTQYTYSVHVLVYVVHLPFRPAQRLY